MADTKIEDLSVSNEPTILFCLPCEACGIHLPNISYVRL
jgi:hypothetical protein